jgi:hypothetical protein
MNMVAASDVLLEAILYMSILIYVVLVGVAAMIFDLFFRRKRKPKLKGERE